MLNQKIYFGGCTFKVVRYFTNEVIVICSSAGVQHKVIKYSKSDFATFAEFMEVKYGAI
tara:strand:- start:224 stop:400 length:177 start_codon:yes stop_codon:yes gene_type:complete